MWHQGLSGSLLEPWHGSRCSGLFCSGAVLITYCTLLSVFPAFTDTLQGLGSHVGQPVA